MFMTSNLIVYWFYMQMIKHKFGRVYLWRTILRDSLDVCFVRLDVLRCVKVKRGYREQNMRERKKQDTQSAHTPEGKIPGNPRAIFPPKPKNCSFFIKILWPAKQAHLSWQRSDDKDWSELRPPMGLPSPISYTSPLKIQRNPQNPSTHPKNLNTITHHHQNQMIQVYNNHNLLMLIQICSDNVRYAGKNGENRPSRSVFSDLSTSIEIVLDLKIIGGETLESRPLPNPLETTTDL